MAVLSSYERIGSLTLWMEDEQVSYLFRSGAIEQESTQSSVAIQPAVDLAVELDGTFFMTGTTDQRVRSVAETFMVSAVPPDIASLLRQWNGADRQSLLSVETEVPWLADLPWELVSAALGGGLFVARKAISPEPAAEPGLETMTMLLAAWSRLPTGDKLPGVMRELGQLPAQLTSDQVSVAPLHSPTVEQLITKAAEVSPNVVHVVTASGFGADPADSEPGDDWARPTRPEAPTYLWLDPLPTTKQISKSSQSPPQRMQDDELIDLLGGMPELRLCVINTMPNPPVANSPLYRRLSSALGVPVVGWSGAIDDSIAVDFSLFLYQRIIEGASLPDAVRSFSNQFADAQWVSGAIPTVWVPSDGWLDQPVMRPVIPAAEASSDQPLSFDLSVPPSAAPVAAQVPAVVIDFQPRESLFPSLLINGQDAFKALTLTARQACEVRLEITCDAGGRQSVYSRIRSLLAGPNTIDVREIGFPVLYELMASNEPRIVNFQVAVSLHGNLVAQITRSVRWRARCEWLDSDDSYAYIPSFVLPMSRAVAKLLRDAESILTQIAGPQESFSGYRRDKEARVEAADRQVRAIYQALRGWGLKYITPPGTPVFVLDPSADPTADATGEPVPAPTSAAETVVQSGQLVRFPDEIVERGHGTCHDLSLLLAAAIEYVNLRPIVVILPGHTLLGFWLDDAEHDLFWRTRSLAPGIGLAARWELTGADLQELVDGGKVCLVEATLVTNPIATYEQAKRRGEVYLQQDVRAAIDVRRSRESIQPLSFG